LLVPRERGRSQGLGEKKARSGWKQCPGQEWIGGGGAEKMRKPGQSITQSWGAKRKEQATWTASIEEVKRERLILVFWGFHGML